MEQKVFVAPGLSLSGGRRSSKAAVDEIEWIISGKSAANKDRRSSPLQGAKVTQRKRQAISTTDTNILSETAASQPDPPRLK